MYKIETEREDLFDVNMMIAMKVSVAGVALPQELENAFFNAVKSHQILSSKVVTDRNDDAFYEVCQEHNNRIFFRDFVFEELIKEQEKIRFRIEDGEFLRLFISIQKEEMDFCFLLHHLGGDGKSLCYFIENFFRCLNGEVVGFQPIRLLNKDILPDKSKPSFAAKILAKYYNKKWKKEKRVFGFDDSEKAYQLFWDNHETYTEFHSISGESLRQKLLKCKKSGIGFTAYFIAEMLKDTNTRQDIGLAVDGRLDGNRAMGNQATGISVKYKYNPCKSIAENAKIIARKMKKKLNNPKYKYFILHFMAAFHPTLLDAVNLEYAGYFHSHTSRQLADLMGYRDETWDWSITNLTRLDIPVQYGKYKISDFWFVPPVVSYGKNIIGMVTIGDTLNISFHRYAK